MGIYDRDYERSYDTGSNWRPEGQGGGGIQLRKPQTVVGWVLLVTILAYFVQIFCEPGRGVQAANPVEAYFGLFSDWFREPWRIYTLLTYGFLHSPDNLMHIAGNMFGFWLFGRMLEQNFGSREFLLFYLTAIVAGGLAFCLGQAAMRTPGFVYGASGGTVAVTILFALLYPNVRIHFMMILPMPMWVLGCLIVGGDILGALGRSGSQVAFVAHLGGAAFALLYHYRGWRLSRWAPGEWSMPSFKRRPKLRVHREEYEDDRDEPTSSFDEDVNRVLAKISEQGQDSLTRKERRLLEQASQEYKRRGS